MANEIERRYGSQGLHALSLHPGVIKTGIQVHVSAAVQESWSADGGNVFFKSTAQGAATTVYGAISKDWEGKGGRYLETARRVVLFKSQAHQRFSYAYDEEKEKKLWLDSLKMVGFEGDE